MPATSSTTSSSSVARFVCDDCSRVYRTRDSLTRHRHNHDHVSQHVCLVCSLAFSRSDVLARHARIHSKGRRRSPRACLPCKLAKMKCNATEPCSRCAGSFQMCTYEAETAKSGRESAQAFRPLPQGSTGILSEDGSIANLPDATAPSSTAFEANSGLNMITSTTDTLFDSNLVSPEVLPTATADLRPRNYFEMQIKPMDTIAQNSWSPSSDPWLQSLNMPLLSTDWLRQPGGICNTNYLDMGINSTTNPMVSGADVLQGLDFGLSSSASNTLACTTLGSIALSRPGEESSVISAGLSLFDTINNFPAEPPWFLSSNSAISQRKSIHANRLTVIVFN